MVPKNLTQWYQLNERANEIDEEVYENRKEWAIDGTRKKGRITTDIVFPLKRLYEEKRKAILREIKALEEDSLALRCDTLQAFWP